MVSASPVKLETKKNKLTPLKENVKKEVHTGSDTDSDMSDREDMHSDFLKLREESLKMNQVFFNQLGISEAKQSFEQTVKKKKASERGLKRETKPKEIVPRRSSLRLQNKTPEGLELPPEYLINRAALFTSYKPVEHNRPPAGTLSMTEYLHGTSSSEEHDHMVKLFSALDTKPAKPKSSDLDRYIARVKKIKITENQVAKVVPERTFSVAIHPSADKVLAVTGDKWGKLGLWDVMTHEESKSDGVCCYAPHSRPICCLEFPVSNPEKLYSCSYDGSLRCCDMRKEVFEEIYSVPEEEDILLRNFNFTSPQTMLVSRNDGCVSLVDTRTKGTEAEHVYNLHNKSLRTVSVHPTEQHYFCTGGVEGVVRVWDMRKVTAKNNKHLSELALSRGIHAAYFSPLTGKYILTTSMDDKITIFDSSTIGPGIKVKKAIRHNNHTGRWLTPFRAAWHPAREDVFVVGSMNRPREIELFADDGTKICSLLNEDFLGSVCSLNALHPTRDIVVGANSSGRLHVFM